MSTNSGRSVLVCDPNRDLSGALQLILEDEGYGVTVAESVDEGLDLLRASRDGMIVVWDATPEIGGLDLLSAVLDDKVAPTRHGYVLLTTGPASELLALTRILPTLRMSVVQMPFMIQTLVKSVALAAFRRAVDRPAELTAIS